MLPECRSVWCPAEHRCRCVQMLYGLRGIMQARSACVQDRSAIFPQRQAWFSNLAGGKEISMKRFLKTTILSAAVAAAALAPLSANAGDHWHRHGWDTIGIRSMTICGRRHNRPCGRRPGGGRDPAQLRFGLRPVRLLPSLPRPHRDYPAALLRRTAMSSIWTTVGGSSHGRGNGTIIVQTAMPRSIPAPAPSTAMTG